MNIAISLIHFSDYRDFISIVCFCVGETLSNTTTVEQLGVSTGQSIDLTVHIQEVSVLSDHEENDNIHPDKDYINFQQQQKLKQQKQQQRIFTVQVRVGKNDIIIHVHVFIHAQYVPFIAIDFHIVFTFRPITEGGASENGETAY